MDIRSIRHRNLRTLVDQAGSQRALARLTGVSAVYLCQILSPSTSRNVGHTIARRLEVGMELPVGWMDTNQTPAPIDTR